MLNGKSYSFGHEADDILYITFYFAVPFNMIVMVLFLSYSKTYRYERNREYTMEFNISPFSTWYGVKGFST